MSDTPETDKCVKANKHLKFLQEDVGVNTNKITYENPIVFLCQKLERERDEERKEGEEQARLLGMGSEREAKLIAERDLWRAEAQRWREQALDLEAQIETAIKRIQWRQDNLDREIKDLKGDY